MADTKEKNRKKPKSIKAKANKSESTFVSRTSKTEKKGRMKNKGKGRDDGKRKRQGGGPRLTNVLRKELGMLEDKSSSDSGTEGEEGVRDLYELDEEVAQEELGKNRRFDEVENYEYELPEDFKVCPKKNPLYLTSLCFFFLLC